MTAKGVHPGHLIGPLRRDPLGELPDLRPALSEWRSSPCATDIGRIGWPADREPRITTRAAFRTQPSLAAAYRTRCESEPRDDNRPPGAGDRDCTHEKQLQHANKSDNKWLTTRKG